MNKIIATASIVIVIMTIASSQVNSIPAIHAEQRERLKSLVASNIDALGSTEFDKSSTVRIERAADDYLAKLALQDAARRDFIVGSLNQELIEAEKNELTIKVLLRALKSEELKADECEGIARFLRRYQAADVDSTLVAVLMQRDMAGDQMLESTNLNSAWLSYLKQSGGARLVLSQRVLSHAGRDSETGSQKWTTAEQQNIDDAVVAYKTQLLALRILRKD